jgi:hypothetical protein
MRAFAARLTATLRAMVRFLCLLSAALLRAIRALAQALRSVAASLRLARSAFARARLLSRLIAPRLRATAAVLVFAVRVLRALAASTRLLRGADATAR